MPAEGNSTEVYIVNLDKSSTIAFSSNKKKILEANERDSATKSNIPAHK